MLQKKFRIIKCLYASSSNHCLLGCGFFFFSLKRRMKSSEQIFFMLFLISFHYPILIRFYPRKQGWPDLLHSNSNLSNSHCPSRSIHGILLLQTDTLALLLYLPLPCLLWLSLLPLSLHFKLQCFSQNMPSSLLNTCPYNLTPFAFAIIAMQIKNPSF